MPAAVLSSSSPAPSDLLAGEHWSVWLSAILPGYCTYPFAPHHAAMWDWVWAIEPGVRPETFIGIWTRGGAKSTSAEASCVALGARRKRRYGLYVCDTQDRADDHVATVASMLESERVELFYPNLGARRLGKHGNSRGWRRNRVWTADGFVIDAIGLDVAARGVKLEDQRPDFLVVDDVDGQHDSPLVTARKMDTLTKALIPAGAEDLAVLAIQNLVHPNGVFARLADGRADFLRRRIVSGPVPALHEFRIDEHGTIHGEPTWAGLSLERCREMAADMGLRAFRSECQHDVRRVEGALWSVEMIDAGRVDRAPDLARVVVAVDPAVTSDDTSDETGIIAAGVGIDGDVYVLADRSCRMSPDGWARRAVNLLDEHEGDRIVAEVNNGGDLVELTLRTVDRQVPYRKVTATRGKRLRAEPVAALYEQGRVHHVGTFPALEDQLCAWTPESGTSPDRLDALVWAVTDLALGGERRRTSFRGAA